MADLLEGLESGLRFGVGASSRLRNLVDRIDRYIITNKSTSSARRDAHYARSPHAVYEGAAQQQQQQAFQPRTHPAQIPNGHARFDAVPRQQQQPYERISAPDVQLPCEMLQDWPWPFEPPDDGILFPDILSGWTH